MEKKQKNLEALENNTPTSPQLPQQQPKHKHLNVQTNMSARAKNFQSIGQENLEEYTVQFSLKKFCGIDSQTNDNDNKLKIYNKIINDVRIIAEWAKESSIFFEFAINHPNSWFINWISSKDKFNHLDIVFHILRSDWKPFKATKDSEKFKELNKLFDEYKKERPQNIRLGPTYNTSNSSSLVEDILPDVEIFKRDEFKNLKFSKFQQNWLKFLKFYLELQKQMKSFVLIPVLKSGLRHVIYSTTALRQFALTLEKETIKE
ncbi:hypothetical protein HCN44_004813 [Aphidius gifuensis]|uniref:Uncharacterized protein n=1 Tax=Aphidius gifuensis TaxID=684658 RepID=A0A834XLZ2_APHGI|nr:hypothetical protein HCN44_004813 [Aphidius gifuensis]